MNLLDLYKSIEKNKTLKEANLKKLYSKTQSETPKIYARAMKMLNNVRYFGLSKDGTLNFKVKSQTRAGKYHFSYIEIGDILKFGDVFEQGREFDIKDLTKLLGMNGFRVHCQCESFLYFAFQYIATINNYEIEPETRAPKRNNVLLAGSLCKHTESVVYNLFNNQNIRNAITKDINNYLRMLEGLDYDDYQQQNYAKQIQQQNRAVKWKNKPSDYMNDYFARSAKNHQFLDDKDIKKSLKREMNKYLKAKPESSVDDFLRSYFQMTQKAFADDMAIPEGSIEEYFDELGFTDKKTKLNTPKEEIIEEEPREDTSILGNSVMTKDSEDITKSAVSRERKFKVLQETTLEGIKTKPNEQKSNLSTNTLQESKTDEQRLKESIKLYKEYLDLHISSTEEVFNKLIELAEEWKKDNNLDENQDHPYTWILDNQATLTQQINKHDESKYTKEEFEEYRKHFYPISEEESLSTEGFKNACTVHVSNNAHHWEYWCSLQENGKYKLKDNIDKHKYNLALIERVCDESCMSQFFENRLKEWYKENSYKMCELEDSAQFYKTLVDIIHENELDINESVTKAYKRLQAKKDIKLNEAQVTELKVGIDKNNLYVHTDNTHKSIMPTMGKGFYLFNVNSVAEEKYKSIKDGGDTKYYRLIKDDNVEIVNDLYDKLNLTDEQVEKIIISTGLDKEYIEKAKIHDLLKTISKEIGENVSLLMTSIGIDGILVIDMENSYVDHIKQELIIYNMGILKDVTLEVLNDR